MLKENRISLEGSDNTRDLGGFTAAGGAVIRSRRLIRSGKLSEITENDRRILIDEYHLKKIIDFRTAMEKKQSPDPHIEGVQYIELPIFDERVSGITHEKRPGVIPEGEGGKPANPHPGQMVLAYRRMIEEEYSRRQYRRFFDILLENEEGSVLWHCTMGKDRAGLGTVLLLSALDVSREDILTDYLLTNSYCEQKVDRILTEVLDRAQGELDSVVCREFFKAREDYIGEALRAIEELFGSMDNFLQSQMGLRPERLAKLRRMYLV